MQRGTWLVERCFCDKPKVVTIHLGVSYACLLVPVVKHLPPRAGAGALGKGRLTRVCFLGHFLSAENLPHGLNPPFNMRVPQFKADNVISQVMLSRDDVVFVVLEVPVSLQVYFITHGELS